LSISGVVFLGKYAMNAHKIAITFSEDGKLKLTGLHFYAGETVEIIFFTA
jgi:hypothetical protein